MSRVPSSLLCLSSLDSSWVFLGFISSSSFATFIPLYRLPQQMNHPKVPQLGLWQKPNCPLVPDCFPEFSLSEESPIRKMIESLKKDLQVGYPVRVSSYSCVCSVWFRVASIVSVCGGEGVFHFINFPGSRGANAQRFSRNGNTQNGSRTKSKSSKGTKKAQRATPAMEKAKR